MTNRLQDPFTVVTRNILNKLETIKDSYREREGERMSENDRESEKREMHEYD